MVTANTGFVKETNRLFLCDRVLLSSGGVVCVLFLFNYVVVVVL